MKIYKMSELPKVEEKSCENSSEDSFKEQTEKLVTSCSIDQLDYLTKAIISEREFRHFSSKKVNQLRETLKQIEKEFDRKMDAKKQLLAAKFIAEESCEESESEESEKPKKKLAPSKTKRNTKRKN